MPSPVRSALQDPCPRTILVNFSRRRFILGAAAAGATAVGVDAWLVEPRCVTITRHVLGVPDASRATMRLVQLSDLHLHGVGSHERRIAAAVGRLAPDVVLVTGDAIDRPDRLGALAAFLGLLPPRTSGYATLGNWEHWAGVDLAGLRRVYAAAGIRLLVDETAEHRHRGSDVLFTGVDDATGGHPDVEQALRGVAPRANHLLLGHSPAYRDRLTTGAPGALSPYSITCMLAGHTHGGQVAPLGHALVLPRGSGSYVKGWYEGPPLDMYVSRGLGTSVLPLRLGSPPEIAVFDWHLA